jgi:hypothetical protein
MLDLYSIMGDKMQCRLHRFPNYCIRLVESGFDFPEDHLEKFQSYAKAGNVIGLVAHGLRI